MVAAGLSQPPRRVLVADDDGTTRLLIKTALEQDGWTVEEAADGLTACASIQRSQPDVVLLDVLMPKLDGFETCARLRAMPSGEHIPVLMMTGMDDQESISRAYEAGATDFLTKPFNSTILRQRLQYMYRARLASCQLQEERDFVSAVVDTSAALVLVLDRTGHVTRFNRSCQRVSGLSAQEAQGVLFWDLLSSVEERDRERSAFERLISSAGMSNYEGSWTTSHDTRAIAWSNSVLLNHEGDVEHVVYTGLDITERNEAEERVRFLASYDPLTGLPNRRLVTERLEEEIGGDARGGLRLAVLFLDLDRFKYVNATWGHSAGDLVLSEVAARLSKSLRLTDVLARNSSGLRTELGRLGGDEFTAALVGASGGKEVARIVERLQNALSRPFKVEDHGVTVTASVGVALYPTDGSDADTLLRNAESAMHSARDDVTRGYHFYSPEMQTSVSDRLSLEGELRNAIERGELELHYQPKTCAKTGRLTGVEALVRWLRPSEGLVPPVRFIGLAEETGLIIPIGEWVLRQACSHLTGWLESGLRPVPVAVNLSSAQFRLDDLLERVGAILNETGMDPAYLAVEITESMLMRDAREAREILCRLNDLGVEIAIDDFGTGYSTLSTLKDFPVHSLKIDQAFIKDLATNTKDLSIARAIIAMAHGLDLTVVAEGVESHEQLELLRDEGCDQVQGYLISQPLSRDRFEGLLRDRVGTKTAAVFGHAVPSAVAAESHP